MIITIRQLEKWYKDLNSSELIAILVDDGYEDEYTGKEIQVKVTPLTDDEYYDSSGYTWKTQINEAHEKGLMLFSVQSVNGDWNFGLVTE